MASLPFVIQKQPALNICWAAVAASISSYYDPASIFTQCIIVNQQLGRADCCNDINACDVPGYLDQALTYTGNFRNQAAGLPDFPTIQQEIGNNYVIALRVFWLTNNQGHGIVISGCHDDQTVDVQDPWPTSNPGTLSLAQLQQFYQDVGVITDTYFIKRPTDP